MKNIMINNSKILKTIQILLSLVLFVTPIIYLIIFIFYGVSSAFGSNINLFSAISMVLNFFDILTFSVYRPLFGTVLGIVYLIFLAMICTNIITSISTLKYALKKNNSNEDRYKDRPVFLMSLLTKFGNTLFLLITYMVISRMIGTYKMNSQAIGIIISGIVIYILSRVGTNIIEYKNLATALYYNLLQDGITLTALAIFFLCVCNVDIYEFFKGFEVLGWITEYASPTTTVSIIGDFFINNATFIVLQIFALQAAKEILTSYNYYYSVDKYTAKALMIATISVSAILVALSIYISDSYTSDSILFTAKQYASMLACSIALYISLNLPMFVFNNRKNNSDTVEKTGSIDNYTNNSWVCSCGARNMGNSCSVCFKSRPNKE